MIKVASPAQSERANSGLSRCSVCNVTRGSYSRSPATLGCAHRCAATSAFLKSERPRPLQRLGQMALTEVIIPKGITRTHRTEISRPTKNGTVANSTRAYLPRAIVQGPLRPSIGRLQSRSVLEAERGSRIFGSSDSIKPASLPLTFFS